MTGSLTPTPTPWGALPRPRRRPRAGGGRATSLDERTVAAVLAQYGLAPTGELITLGPGGRNHTVRVATARGPVVVKRYPTHVAATEIRHEHAIADELRHRRLPVPPLLRTGDGASWVEVERGRYGVTAYAPGRSFSGFLLAPATATHLYRSAGDLLGRVHLALQDFRPPGRHHLADPAERVTPGGLPWYLDTLDHLVHTAAPRDAQDPERWLAAEGGAVAAELARLDERLRQRRLDRGVIHGDYGLHNLTFTGDGEVVLHDLELARRDLLLLDVVTVLSRASVRRGRAFLDGYQPVRRLDAEAWAALSEVWQHYRLCGAVRSWHNHRRWGGRRRLETARRRVIEARRVARQGVDPWR